MKKCTFCAEEIQDAALICRYCRSEQPPRPESVPRGVPEGPIAAPASQSRAQRSRTAAKTLMFVGGAVAILIILGIIGAAIEEGTKISRRSTPVGTDVSSGTTVDSEPSPRIPEGPRPGVTLANYLRLEEGMTYAEVVRILGSSGVEQSRVDLAGMTTVMYAWEGWGFGANMNAMFQNGKLISKAQWGLQ